MNETTDLQWAGDHPASRDVLLENGRQCRLSRREAELYAFLAQKAGTTVSREEILARVWRLNPRVTITRTIDMHISMLRRKLGDDAARPDLLRTIHGKGYMFQG